MAKNAIKQKNLKRKRRNRNFLLVIVFLLIVNIGLFTWYRFKNPITMYSKNYEVQVNTRFDGLDNLKSVFLGDPNEVLVSGDVDTNTLGTYKMTYTYRGQAYPFEVKVTDMEGPTLETQDYVTDTVENVEDTRFVVTCKDDSIFTLKMEVSGDSKQPGTYPVTITATDKFGNETVNRVSLTRILDAEPPTLENFQEEVTIGIGDSFSPSSYAVVDNLDDNPIVYIDNGGLDTMEPGTYTITYQLKDRSGNEATYKQTVTVQDRKVAYLTFDDGPSSTNTQRILDVLDQYDIKATFFVTGADPNAYDLMKEEAERGHTVALHTMSHDYSIYASPETYFDDLYAIQNLVKEQTGQESKLIRFPGGSSNTVSANYSSGIMSYLSQAVLDAGFQYFDWNVSSGDAAGNNVPVETIVSNATSSIGEPLAVFLFHDTDAKDTTVEALPAIIEAYKAAGYVFLPLDINSYPAHHGINN